MTLETEYNKSKRWYENRYGKDSWQWKDEGSFYAVGDYFGSMGEFSEKDWEFAKKEGIEEELCAAREFYGEDS